MTMDRTIVSSVLDVSTYFAPAGRQSPAEIEALSLRIQSDTTAQAIMDATPLVVFILNDQRQVVYVNRLGLEVFGGRAEAIIGKRLGELFGCAPAHGGPDGCGTGEACKMCGAVNAILQAQTMQQQAQEEWRIATVGGSSFDWKVTASPLTLGGETLQYVALEDIGDHKRRQVLERTFFHDIMNTIGALIGFSRMLIDESTQSEELNEVVRLADELMEEVQAQRELTLAESGDLVPRPEKLELKVFLERLADLYRSHPAAEGRSIRLCCGGDVIVTTDTRLFKRVLGNMVKNALEACEKGDCVTLSCAAEDGGGVVVAVHNPTVMANHVKLQMFNRSFSTKKGTGRGIGTYSMKLLGEHYLGGTVSFVSEPDRGTTFSIRLP